MSALRLLVSDPNQPKIELPLEGEITLGRGERNACVLLDPSVSTEHARIRSVGEGFEIEDLGSSNKTKVVNGPVLTQGMRAKLEPGMVLQLGRVRLEVLGASAREAQTLPAPGAPAVNEAVTLPRATPAKLGGDEAATAPRAALQEQATVQPARPPTPAPVSKPAPAPAPAPVASKPAAPKPAPAPAPKVAPSPAQDSVPVPATFPTPGDDLEGFDPTLPAKGAGGLSLNARRAKLEAVQARLIYRSGKKGFSAPVDKEEVLVGRRKTAEVPIGLEDEGVSIRHARIRFDGNGFWIEDLGSTNGTRLGKEQLAPNAARTLHGDTLVRLGTVDALFVVAQPLKDLECPPPELYDVALRWLAERGTLSSEQAKKAREIRKGTHPAAELLLAGVLSFAQWTEALEAAHMQQRMGSAMGGKRWVLIASIAVALAALGLALFMFLTR